MRGFFVPGVPAEITAMTEKRRASHAHPAVSRSAELAEAWLGDGYELVDGVWCRGGSADSVRADALAEEGELSLHGLDGSG